MAAVKAPCMSSDQAPNMSQKSVRVAVIGAAAVAATLVVVVVVVLAAVVVVVIVVVEVVAL